jgi:hypothetical protein
MHPGLSNVFLCLQTRRITDGTSHTGPCGRYTLGTQPVALTTESHGVRGLAHYMSLEEAVAVKRISTENNRPYLLSDDTEVKTHRRATRSATLDAKAMEQKTSDNRLNQSARGLPSRRCTCCSEKPRRRQGAAAVTNADNSCAVLQLRSLDPWPEKPSRWDQLPHRLLARVSPVL